MNYNKYLFYLKCFIVLSICVILVEGIVRIVFSYPPSYTILNDNPFFSNVLKLNNKGIYAHDTKFHTRTDSILKANIANYDLESVFEQKNDILRKYYSWRLLSRYCSKNILSYFPEEFSTSFKLELENDCNHQGFNRFSLNLLEEFSSANEGDTFLIKNIRKYLENPINSDGFRSIEFSDYNQSKRKKILLLGDSFTWGFSAMPLHNSFSDLLLENGYIVYNAAIPATNVLNYYANALEYINLVHPDIVIVFFYENDFVDIELDLSNETYVPGYLIEYGFLPSVVNGKYYGEEKEWLEAVKICFKAKLNPLLTKSILYHHYLRIFNPEKFNDCFFDGNNKVSATVNYLKDIELLANSNNADFKLVLITKAEQVRDKRFLSKMDSIFCELNPIFPYLNESDYRLTIRDPHYNNSGHHKIYNLVKSEIINE